MPELRIVLPACNEAARIVPTIRDYCTYFGERANVVVVANGCTDMTEELVMRLRSEYPNLHLVAIPSRIGKGGAVRVGFASGSEELLGFADADGSTGAAQFDRLIRRLSSHGADAVMGSRWSKGAVLRKPQPAARRAASRVFNLMVRLFFGLHFRDTQCGAKIFRRAAIEAVLPSLELSNFAFDIDILRQLRLHGYMIEEIPIEWSETFVGSQVQLIPAALSMFAALMRLRLRDSVIGSVPFFDYLARSSVIPVRRRLTLLIFARVRPWESATEFLRILGAQGHDVRWLLYARGGFFSTARVFFWYALFGRRRYDAIFEVPSDRPFIIPSFSVKPKFLLEAPAASISSVAQRLYGRYYSGVKRIAPFEVSGAAAAGADVLRDLQTAGAYPAVFDRQDGAWALHFTDMGTGIPKRERL